MFSYFWLPKLPNWGFWALDDVAASFSCNHCNIKRVADCAVAWVCMSASAMSHQPSEKSSTYRKKQWPFSIFNMASVSSCVLLTVRMNQSSWCENFASLCCLWFNNCIFKRKKMLFGASEVTLYCLMQRACCQKKVTDVLFYLKMGLIWTSPSTILH